MKRMWSEEEIQSFKKDISNLVDSKGNPRFVEGEGTPATIEGFTSTYCKWSLSGTHLMLVLAGSVADETTITARNVCDFNVPKFILDKVTPVVIDNIERKTATMYAQNISTQNLNLLLYKENTKLRIYNTSSVTLTADRTFRIQFDLLIDSE